jgi:hypothetical protein
MKDDPEHIRSEAVEIPQLAHAIARLSSCGHAPKR